MDQKSQTESSISKTCTRCSIQKPLFEFHKASSSSGTKDGYCTICKSCRKLEKLSTNHPVSVSSKMCRTCKAIKLAHYFYKNRLSPDGLAYDCKLCAHILQKPYKTSDAAKIRNKSRRRSTGRYAIAVGQAKRRNIEFTISKDEYYRLVSLQCEYCGCELDPAGIGLDRKDNNIGYIIQNVVPCCKYCNTAKLNYWTYDIMKSIIGPAIRMARLAGM